MGGEEKVFVSSISLLVDRDGLLEPAELQFLPAGQHLGQSNPLKAQHYLRAFLISLPCKMFLRGNLPANNQ